MRVLQNASTPVARWHMGDGEATMLVVAPPVKFHDLFEPEVGDQVENMMGNNDGGRFAGQPASFLSNRAQRAAMQVVEVSMGYENEVDRRQIAHPDARFAQPFQDEQPAGEVR